MIVSPKSHKCALPVSSNGIEVATSAPSHERFPVLACNTIIVRRISQIGGDETSSEFTHHLEHEQRPRMTHIMQRIAKRAITTLVQHTWLKSSCRSVAGVVLIAAGSARVPATVTANDIAMRAIIAMLCSMYKQEKGA